MSNDILILLGNMVLFNHLQDVSLGVIIDGTVASEGNAVLCVSRKRRYQRRVFDLLVEVADEGASGQM